MPVLCPKSRHRTLATRAWAGGCLLEILLLLWGTISSLAQPPAREWANEYQLKAAYVYKLMAFIDWPAGAVRDRMIVGLAGEGPIAAALTAYMNGKQLGALPIEVRDVRSQAEMRACNVLIVAYPDDSRTREVLLHVRNMSVLTIGDGEAFARMGGVIALVPRENTLQLTINPRAAERANLKISSKLLNMAKLLSAEDRL